MKLKSILAAGVMSCLAGFAYADTVTYSSTPTFATDVAGQQVSVSQFNPGLGTLQSATFALGAVMSSTLSVVSDGNFQIGWDKLVFSLSMTGEPDTMYSGLGIAGDAGATRVVGTGVADGSFTSAERASINAGTNPATSIFSIAPLSATESFAPFMIDDFIGTGTVNFYLTTVNDDAYIVLGLQSSGQPANAGISIRTNVTALVTATYMYAPSPVPEPSTYAMLLAGLAGVLRLARRRTGAAA